MESPFQGFGSLVLKQLLKFAFEELKLNKVSVNVLKNNLKALRFFQSNGFIQEGINRSYSLDDNIPIDAIILSMISTEYEAVKTNN